VKIKPVVAVPLVVLLLGAAAWRLVSYAQHKPTAKPVPIRCETCGHEFVPRRGDENPVCPKCGNAARLRLLYFRCKDCSETFVAYETDPVRGVTRVPGGEWMRNTDCDLRPRCPKCGSERTYFVRTPHEAPGKPAEGT
jgi:Zn finger protein HypA/HybF involved in hydrogenase expression